MLHTLFGEQYNDLFEAIDLIAERIRVLGVYALPFESDHVLESTNNISNALNKETETAQRATRMVHNLIQSNQSTIEKCQAAKEIAQKNLDHESENLMVERITAHQKILWMLNSTIL